MTSTRLCIHLASAGVGLVLVLFVGLAGAMPTQYGPWEAFEAEYLVAPVPFEAGQTVQPVTLRRSNGERYVRSLRPIPAEYGLVGRWVRVEGRRILGTSPGDGSLGPFFEVETISDVRSGTRRLVARSLPAPPLITEVGAGLGLEGRWRMVLGVLERLTQRGAVVRTRAGESLVLHSIPLKLREKVWMPLLGEDVTAAVLFGQDATGAMTLRGEAICQGRAPRCGMLPGQTQGPSAAFRPRSPAAVRRPKGSVASPSSNRVRGPVRPKAPSAYHGR